MADKKKKNHATEEILEDVSPGGDPPAEAAESNLVDSNAAIQAELLAEKDRYLRLAAEYDNYRKRQSKEREGLYADVRADTLSRLLPVYDNLERALLIETEDEAYYKGVSMIMTQFQEIMESLGVTQIAALGEAFDPACHNAVMHVEDAAYGENEIIEVFQQGFTLGEKIIRCAMVKVAN